MTSILESILVPRSSLRFFSKQLVAFLLGWLRSRFSCRLKYGLVKTYVLRLLGKSFYCKFSSQCCDTDFVEFRVFLSEYLYLETVAIPSTWSTPRGRCRFQTRIQGTRILLKPVAIYLWGISAAFVFIPHLWFQSSLDSADILSERQQVILIHT